MDHLVASIAERELGRPPDGVARVSEGLLHETYELDCGGEAYVLQFASDADEDRVDALERGLHWYVALRGSGIPVPRVVTESPREFDGRSYALVERLPGETAKLDVSPGRARNAGGYLARIHDAWSFDRAGWIRFEDGTPTVHGFETDDPGRRIRRSVAESAGTLRDGGLETAGSAVEALFDRLDGDLPAAFRPVLCHGDFSPDNVLFRDGDVTGILDFDRAHAGHAQRDLANAANAFWMHDPGADWDVRAALYEGYRNVRNLGGSFERTEPIYRVETLARLVAGLLELDELSDYERAFYDERLLEAVERAEEAVPSGGG